MFCMVLQFYIPTHKCEGWEKINNLQVKVLLEGVYDERCVESMLKGHDLERREAVLAGTDTTAQLE